MNCGQALGKGTFKETDYMSQQNVYQMNFDNILDAQLETDLGIWG